jgi:hypothetical protein
MIPDKPICFDGREISLDKRQFWVENGVFTEKFLAN